MEDKSLNQRVLQRLEEKIAAQEFMTSEIENTKKEKKKSNTLLKVASMFIIPIIVGNVYTYATYDQDIFSFVLDKIGIFADNESITQINESKISENGQHSEAILTLESYGIDEKTLIVSYRCKLSEKYDYFLEYLIDETKIVDGEKVYVLEGASTGTFSKVSDLEYEIIKMYNIDTENLSNNAKCVSNLRLYKEFEGPLEDMIGEWDFEFKLDKDKSKISNEEYVVQNKSVELNRIEDVDNPLPTKLELLTIHKSSMATKLVLFLEESYSNIEYTIEVLDENNEIILEKDIQTIVGDAPISVIMKPLENEEKIIINIYEQEHGESGEITITAKGTIEVDLTKDLTLKEDKDNENDKIDTWNDL